MPDDENDVAWLPGGPRPLGSSLAYTETARSGGSRPWASQRMSKRDLARMGEIMATEQGKTVLEIVEAVARGEAQLSTQRLQAAIAALPYRHPRLVSATVRNVDPFEGWTAEQLERALKLLEQHPELAEGLEREARAAAG